MGTLHHTQERPIPALQVSIDTILGQERYLENITEDLYRNGVCYGHELANLSEAEFRSLIGRTTEENIQRVKKRLRDLGIFFSATK